MKLLSGKGFCRLVERRGWQLLRVKGSHHVYGKPGLRVRLSVPVHGSTPLKEGLQRHLMKLAALTLLRRARRPRDNGPPHMAPRPHPHIWRRLAAKGKQIYDEQSERLQRRRDRRGPHRFGAHAASRGATTG